MASASKVLYIGVTNDLERRVFEHKADVSGGFTSKYRVHRLAYYEQTEKAEDAIQREKQLKNWHRQWKINLIESVNPNWKDLSCDWDCAKNEEDAETSSA